METLNSNYIMLDNHSSITWLNKLVTQFPSQLNIFIYSLKYFQFYREMLKLNLRIESLGRSFTELGYNT